jgi:hypothetical protein
MGSESGSAMVRQLIIYEDATISAPAEFSVILPPPMPTFGIERVVSSNVPLGSEMLLVHGRNRDVAENHPNGILVQTSSNASLFNQDRIRHVASGHVWQVGHDPKDTLVLPDRFLGVQDTSFDESRFNNAMAITIDPSGAGNSNSSSYLDVWSRARLSNVLYVTSNATFGGPVLLEDGLFVNGSSDVVLSNNSRLDAFVPVASFPNASFFVGSNLTIAGTSMLRDVVMHGNDATLSIRNEWSPTDVAIVKLGLHANGSNAYLDVSTRDGLELRTPCIHTPENTSIIIRSGTTAARSAITISSNNTVGISLSNGTLPAIHELEVDGTIFATRDVLALSDERVKVDVEVIQNALDRVSALRGVTFSYCNDVSRRRRTGLIAQDVEAVLPEAVQSDGDSGLLSIAYGNIVGLLVEAIREIRGLLAEINTKSKHSENIT